MQHAQHVPTSVGAATGVYTTSQWLVISGRIRCNSDKPSGITWVFFHFKRNLTACLVNKGYVRDLLGWMMEAMRNRILPWIMTCMKFLCPSAETGTNSRVDAEWVPTSFLLQTSFFLEVCPFGRYVDGLHILHTPHQIHGEDKHAKPCLPVIKRGNGKSKKIRDYGWLSYWNLHIYSGFPSVIFDYERATPPMASPRAEQPTSSQAGGECGSWAGKKRKRGNFGQNTGHFKE